MNWINVSQRLPEICLPGRWPSIRTSHWVLARTERGRTVIAQLVEGKDGVWWDRDLGEDSVDVAHWMPLPEPP